MQCSSNFFPLLLVVHVWLDVVFCRHYGGGLTLSGMFLLLKCPQHSCSTFHMHQRKTVSNDSLIFVCVICIPGAEIHWRLPIQQGVYEWTDKLINGHTNVTPEGVGHIFQNSKVHFWQQCWTSPCQLFWQTDGWLLIKWQIICKLWFCQWNHL